MTEKNPLVGPGNFNPNAPVVPKVESTPSADAATKALGNRIIESLRQKGFEVNVSGTNSAINGLSFIDSVVQDEAKALELGKLLRARKKNVSASKGAIANLFNTEPELITIRDAAKGDYNTLISLLAEDFVAGLGTKTGDKISDTRSIRKVSDTTINSIIDAVSQSSLRKNITDPTERKALINQIKAKFEEGTLTSTKKVKNPKTGKWESVSTTSGPTSEEIQLQLAQDLEKNYADDYESNQSLEFNNFLDKMNNRGV